MAPNMGAVPIIYVMEAFKVSAEDAIDHLRANRKNQSPIYVGSGEIVQMIDQKARALTKKYNHLSLDMSFIEVSIHPVARHVSGPH